MPLLFDHRLASTYFIVKQMSFYQEKQSGPTPVGSVSLSVVAGIEPTILLSLLYSIDHYVIAVFLTQHICGTSTIQQSPTAQLERL